MKTRLEEIRDSLDKYIIDLWWDHNKYLYETKTPYMEIKK